MKIRHSLLGAFVFSSALIAACSDHDHSGGSGGGSGGHGGEDHHAEGKPTGAVCPSTPTLTYENFGKDFMAKYCLRCHSASLTGAGRNGAPTDHNFDKVEDIRSMAEHIDEVAGAGPNATNTEMPEGDPRPSDEERRKLAEWLVCKAP